MEEKHFSANSNKDTGDLVIWPEICAIHAIADVIFGPLNFSAIFVKSAVISKARKCGMCTFCTSTAKERMSDIFRQIKASCWGSRPASPWGTCKERERER